MVKLVHSSPLLLATVACMVIAACGGGSNSTPTQPTTPNVTVTPAASSITTAQSLSVTITVSGPGSAPTGSVVLSSGSYHSSATALSSGSVTVSIAAGLLATGTDTLTAKYTPDSSSSATYNSASGTGSVTVSAPALLTPTVTVTPAASSITTAQSLSVTITVSGPGSTPTGSIVLSSGSYASSATTLVSGSATVTVAAGLLTIGSDTLRANYTPDSSDSAVYNSSSGTSPVTVIALITPTVTVTPAASSITTAQTLSVTIAVSGSGSTPTGSIVLSSGGYSSSSTTLVSGSGTIIIPAGDLAKGADTLTAAYTPDTLSAITYKASSGTSPITVNALTSPTVTVTPAASSITTAQSLSVTITASGSSGTPSGTIVLSSGSYTSSATTLVFGSATVTIPPGDLATGTDTLTANYTPDTLSAITYNASSGTSPVTVNVPALVTPTVTVTPAAPSITNAQSLSVTIAVSGSSGTPTGSIVLSSGSYASSATTLVSGSATISIAAGLLATGSDTLTAKYTPDPSSSSLYNTASGIGSVTVTAPASAITVSINVLANRHAISPYIYGGAFPQDAAHVTDSGMSLVRWGGNATSTYNWQLSTNNSAADYYFEDYNFGGLPPRSNGDSIQWITDVENAGSHPLMTMVMLPWVAQSAEDGSNGHWSFSVATYGKQCSTDFWVPDAGNGQETDCSTPITKNASTVAYYPLLDDNTETCTGATCVYRDAWAKALATAFGSDPCSVPNSSITSCHFYDMDNEIDIWGGTHRDVHPAPSGYDELATVYVTEAAKLKIWDPAAVRFGPVSCCWWYYWNGANGSDKADHGGVDFLPWWLNQVYWQDQIAGTRTLDVFDIHAYADANTSGLSTAQLKALAADVYRDYWDPTYVSTSGTVTQIYTTSMQPKYSIPFRIPRMRALVNAIYPGTPLAFTEWSAAFAGESDFSTALGDADAYGIFGRERLSFASRWGAPVPTNPNYQALKLYTNYDGAHHSFGTTSVSAVETGSTALLTSYAALNAGGTTMTVMVINKDPNNTASVAFDLSGFNATSFNAYTLASTAPSAISASAASAWNATQSFAPSSV
ncbi:MAG: glycoside hydrolase family 44 protein, partial [Terracidiphilus sp.]